MSLATTFFLLASCVALDAPPSAKDDAKLAAALLAAHNKERAKADLPPFTADAKLAAAALVHAKDMAYHARMTHDGSDGSNAAQRIERQGYAYMSAAENVAEGASTVDAVMKIWMDSPPHRQNILGPYEQIGSAVARDEEGKPYRCVVFASPWPRLDADKAGAEVVSALNKARADAGKPPPEVNAKLTRVAVEEAKLLAKSEGATAANDDAKAFFARLQASGYRYRTLGRTAGLRQATPAAVVKAWLDGAEQTQGVFGDFTEVGVGYAQSEAGIPYWFLILARPR